MKLSINGKEETLENVCTAAELLATLDLMRDRVAIMVNGTVVRRAELEAAKLQDGDTVEIITMVGGG